MSKVSKKFSRNGNKHKFKSFYVYDYFIILNLYLTFFLLNLSLVYFLLEEILSSTIHRCTDPHLMEPRVVEIICETVWIKIIIKFSFLIKIKYSYPTNIGLIVLF